MSANRPSSVPSRHPLGLPAGSVRAVLGLSVLGLLWAVGFLYRPDKDLPLASQRLPMVFIYLQTLMVLILAHYFTAHGKTLGQAVSPSSALGLPSGSVRFLLLFGYVGLSIFLYVNHREYAFAARGAYTLLLTVLLVAYFLGHSASAWVRWASGDEVPPWYQDFQAWIALLAMIALTVVAVLHLFINPNLIDSLPIESDTLEAILAGLVGFYFGARS